MSESDIDMDRTMQGIYDEDSHTKEITWTNCADEMPPDDDALVIVKDLDGLVCREGYIINAWKDRFDDTAKWTHYTWGNGRSYVNEPAM